MTRRPTPKLHVTALSRRHALAAFTAAAAWPLVGCGGGEDEDGQTINLFQ